MEHSKENIRFCYFIKYKFSTSAACSIYNISIIHPTAISYNIFPPLDMLSRGARPSKWLLGWIPRRHGTPSAAVKIRQGRSAPPLILRRFTLYGFLRLCYFADGGGDILQSQPLKSLIAISSRPIADYRTLLRFRGFQSPHSRVPLNCIKSQPDYTVFENGG